MLVGVSGEATSLLSLTWWGRRPAERAEALLRHVLRSQLRRALRAPVVAAVQLDGLNHRIEALVGRGAVVVVVRY